MNINIKTRISIIVLLTFSCIKGIAQESQPDEWITNYSQADSISQSKKTPLLIFFSGSDWCKPCIKLKENILNSDEFISFATDHFVLYNADFPYRKKLDKQITKTNEQLAEAYNPKGVFPKVVVVSPDHKVMGSLGYIDCTADEYIVQLEKLLQ